MTKKILKFLIICGLAAVAGLVLYTQTNIGKELIDDALPVLDDILLTGDLLGSGDIEAMVESGVMDILSGMEIGLSGEVIETTVVMTGLVQTGAGSGQMEAPDTPAMMVTSVLQKRLEYYRSHKKELGM